MDKSSHNVDDQPDFEDDGGAPRGSGGLFLRLEGYEGPIDLLLDLARDQKVDLSQISILALVDQYLRFMHIAKKKRLELAAEYLVMAALLVYLKSKILLPSTAEEAIAAAESAEAIAFRLQRLAAMQKAAEEVFDLPQLGERRLERGPVFKVKNRVETRLDVELYHLLRAYALVQNRHTAVDRAVRKIPVYSLEEAVKNLSRLVGRPIPSWRTLSSFMPINLSSPAKRRSAKASFFAASLELARRGEITLMQDSAFDDIYLKTPEGRTFDDSAYDGADESERGSDE